MEDEMLLIAGAVAVFVLAKPLQDIGGDIHTATSGTADAWNQTLGNVADATNVLQILNPYWYKSFGDPDSWWS